MSTIRIDPSHQKLLDQLLAKLLLQGQKITKKEFIAQLIDNAAHSLTFQHSSPSKNSEEIIPLESDPAWLGLDDTFDLPYPTLSENVDRELYPSDGE